ncbi:penicillin-binding protein 1A [Sphingobium nicotianae]|uniref:Penicillin-binding protein 1A n=1 Tax=Sphingobium nicotianae TaxID=2782607 RepID=A0A9X1DG09_9SPHN|nr:transglycosylase domain-containing protein [Sphingobium nicotianae]MBT2188838.1 transglycosylase domain-containing protein [Sphingobium nicotianae]
MDETSDATSFRLRRDEGRPGLFARVRALLSHRRWRWPAYIFGAFLVFLFLFWLLFARGLPDARTLLDYQPPLPTVVRDVDGKPVYSFARERRVQLQYSDFPPVLINAYLSAEDKTFFSHHGLDFPGLVRAAAEGLMRGQTPRGTSTITQQVAKNLLVGNEASYVRKLKEAILAWRMENVLSKQQIIELYLNQIFLGRNAYGVQAAARAYFDKDVADLKLPEAAYLAILPKGPANYRPEVHMDRALERRNWVLGEMRDNGFITPAQYADAVAQPLGTVAQRGTGYSNVGGYYIEEVRRRLIAAFGETADKGPNSVYAGGLWVRSPISPFMQEQATRALREGLLRYDSGHGWSGPLGKVDVSRWQSDLAVSNIGVDYADWTVAVVLDKSATSAQIGLPNGRTATLPRENAMLVDRRTSGVTFDSLKPGDVIVVKPEGSAYALRNIPAVSGGMMIEDVHTGRVYAMQGGFDSRLSSYNRVTQALRQPGSTIKPFVYAAALDNGMTPASIIVDGPFCVYQGGALGQKCFRNFGGGGSGPQTMRWGVEQSRNLMTVRAASQTGMERVVRTIKGMGIGDYKPYLAFALGAGETTVERMVNAYAMLANHGRQLTPKVIDFVQDRNGKVILPQGWRPCQGCNGDDWDGKPMPRFAPVGRPAMNPMTAFQVVHITEGVIQRGTATILRDLDRPLFGKTGTTNGPTNVWFVGGSPDIVAGVYMGHDQPRSLGGYAQGGRIAAPIWKSAMEPILKDMPKTPFVAPAGIRMVRIDRRSGKRVFGGWPSDDPKTAIIWEAFKPESEPRISMRRDELAERARQDVRAAGPRRDVNRDFAGEQGGIY